MSQGFSSVDWDDAPRLFSEDGRSIAPYPAPAPTGESWRTYFNRLKSEGLIDFGRTEVEDEQDDAAAVFKGYAPVRITSPAEEFDEPISALAAFVKLGHQNGWEIEGLARASSTARGLPYGSGEQRGVLRPDYNIETQWVHLVKPGHGKVSISYTIINGTTRGNRTLRLHNGERKGDADIRRIIKGEEDG